MWFGYVVAKEWVQKWGDRAVARHPLGTGPFIFDHWTPGREVVLKKNPNYWDKGKPYLDELKFVFSLTPSTALLKLERGEIDVLGDNIPPADIPRVLNDPQWKGQVQTQKFIAGVYFYMNTAVQALRQRQGAPGAELGHQPRQAVQAAERPGYPACGSSSPRGCRAQSRARSTTATIPPRPSSSSLRRGTRTASARRSTRTTSTRSRRSSSRSRTTWRRSVSRRR